MKHFKVGDRVICVENFGDISVGLKGVVVEISPGTPPIGVEWEKVIIGGHRCNDTAKENRGYFVFDRTIELLISLHTTYEKELAILARKVIKELGVE